MFLVLHLRHKLEYFKKHKWEPEWISTTRRIICDEFDCSYAPLLADAADTSMQVDKEGAVSTRIFLLSSFINYFHSKVFSTSKNIFDKLPDLAPASSGLHDELDRYLAMDVEDVKDGLLWWFERQTTFPQLSRMVRDYLSIPGTFSDRSISHLLIPFLSHNCRCGTHL